MSTSFSVKGYFANGKYRVTGLHWPGGPTKSDGNFLPEFQKRAQEYAKVFKDELEGAPKRADGLPTFDYIEVRYRQQPSTVEIKVGSVFLAVTPKGLEKLTKEYGAPINFDDANVRYRFSNEATGLQRVSAVGVVDLTKYTNVNAFWSKVRLYANYVYQPVFAKGC